MHEELPKALCQEYGGGLVAKEPELSHEPAAQRREPTIGGLVRSALWMWGRPSPRRMFFLLRVTWRLWRANRRRMRQQRALGGPIPPVVAIGPTMRCNYNCTGCYSRGW